MNSKKLFLPNGVCLPGLGSRIKGNLLGGGNAWQVIRITFEDRGAFIALAFAAVFSLLGLRLLDYRISADVIAPTATAHSSEKSQGLRPPISDRNGVLLAVDVPTPRLYANAQQILEPRKTARALSRIFPGLKASDLERKFASRDPYFIVESVISPSEKEQVMAIGEPGLRVETHPVRLYPGGTSASHIIGHLDSDRRGAISAEARIDEIPNADSFQPLRLTIDLRLQSVIEQRVSEAKEKFQAIGAGAILMDVHNGELLAFASAPAFDPNDLRTLTPEAFNRVTGGRYELGSVFKLITIAAALENSVVTLNTEYDVTGELKVGEHTISDDTPQIGAINVVDIFTRSSNIGAVLMAQDLGKNRHLGFMDNLGLLDPPANKPLFTAPPQLPNKWREAELATVAYGHGYAVSPLQFAAAAAALVNGGWEVKPKLLLDNNQDNTPPRRVISQETSDKINFILRQNVVDGSGRRAAVNGYRVGGKTGTADKPTDGLYLGDKVFNSFLAIFPDQNPRYLLLTFLDEPQAIAETRFNRQAGWNVAPLAGDIIKQISPVLGLEPEGVDGRGFAVEAMMAAAKRELIQRRIAAAMPRSYRPVTSIAAEAN